MLNEIKYIIKRDGKRCQFDERKIAIAVFKASEATKNSEMTLGDAEQVAQNVKNKLIELGNETPNIENVQDIVEHSLMDLGFDDIAKSYILYREKRSYARDSNSSFMKQMEEIIGTDSINSDVKRENANVNGDTTMGIMLQCGSMAKKEYVPRFLLNHIHAFAHKNGDIHIHDMDFYDSTTTCTQIPLDKLFKNGFNTGHGHLRTPQSIASYSSLAAIALQANQNEQHGGQAIPLFDFYMAPGVAKSFIKNYKKHLVEGLEDLIDNYTIVVDTVVNNSLDLLNESPKLSQNEEKFDTDLSHKLLINFKEYKIDIKDTETILKTVKIARTRANRDTDKQTYQAMESFVHNLNTMHCLPYSEKIWVYDMQEEEMLLIEIGDFENIYEKDRYYAISLNKKTFKTELKKITAIQKKDNKRKLITLVTKAGQKVTTTDNHEILSYNEDYSKIVDVLPEEITHVLSPRGFQYPKVKNKIDALHYENIYKNCLDKKTISINENLFNIEIIHKIESNSGEEYVYDISVEDNENFLTKDCIFVHNSRAGAQVPFTSINYGMDTSPEGRMVCQNVMLAQEAGLGNGETAIFPIAIFQVKEGVNYNPEDVNYDLFKLSMRVSAKRLFPNYVFVDAPFNLKYYNPNDIETIIATMGCVDGKEVITYKVKDSLFIESFERAWNRLSKNKEIKHQGLSTYCELEDVTIYDSHSNGFVKCKKIIKNPDMDNWYDIKFTDGKCFTATNNHPLPIKDKGRTFVQDIKIGDKVPLDNLQNKNEYISVKEIEFVGNRDKCSYDVETESDYFDVSGIISHNCRTRVISNVNGKETPVGRGNLSFTSINLPRLGIKHGILGPNHKTDIDGFYKELDEKIDICIEQLLDRFKIQCSKRTKNFPFLMGQGIWRDAENLDWEDTIEDILKQGTLSIGFIGLAETLKALINQHHGESDEAQKLGLEIVGHMRKRMDEATEKYHLNFSVIGTPAEGLSGRFVRMDNKEFGSIKGVTDRDYYTNSNHIPVYYDISAIDKIKLEAPYHDLENAGHITYIEMDGDPTKNLQAFEKVIRVMKESGIGYGSINHPVDTCPLCSYTGIIDDECPNCHAEENEYFHFDRIRRITGYLVGTVDRFNNAKRSEEHDRVKHGINNDKNKKD